MSLVDIFKKYESYSNYDGTDKGTGHCYVELYQQVLNPLKHTAVNVLEIGVFSGASCQAWSEYFTNATVYGMDIQLNRLKFGINNPKIKYILNNATKKDCLQYIPSSFDFILDDGSHFLEDQVASAKLFTPLLNKNGIYICEDIHRNNFLELQKQFIEISENNNLKIEFHDLREVKNHLDDDIVAIFYKS
jgi:hypothetical protein